MKRFNLITILLFLILPIAAQQVETDSLKRAKEREVKTSGQYLYGEAVHEKKSEAIKTAKLILTSEINKEILARPNWQFAKKIEAKDVEYSTDHIDLLRGSKTRVIAFIRKDGLEAIFDQSGPNIQLVDKREKEDKKKEKPEVAATTTEEKVVDPVYDIPVKEDPITKSPTPTPTPAPTPTPTPTPTEPLNNKPIVAIIEEPVDDNTLNEITPAIQTDHPILNELLTAKNVNDASALLTKYKRNGKLVYGKPEANLAMEQSYLMLYDRRGNITAILDKAVGKERVNLRTGETVTGLFASDSSYIWFQLFD